MSESTHDVIRSIAAAPDSAQPALINDFLRKRWGQFRMIGHGLCRNFGVDANTHGDDFTSMVAEEAYKMLTEHLADQDKLDLVENWDGMLKVRSRQIVRNFLDKEMAPAAEMSSTLRRIRLLNQTRDLMRHELGAEPTDRQVVETHNAKMRAQRVNPVKQGVLATVDDLHAYRACADIDDHDYSEPIDPDFVLHPAEGPRFVKLIVKRTTSHNPVLGRAAELWLSGLYRTDGPPIVATVKEIATEMGISISTVRTYILKIQEYAIIVAQDEFGITDDDL
ncbi:hypothetical protein [Arthrobacter sp. A2-55]|uniref:hypothetical protein n=1 Tax=Arthrobacter sp. A2-55 TaxID=2897337 RepID=UPI0021CD7B58|nr:hypothetical protein [Arthrobacter sp. A2-55]MCU6481283.1 hypothetical protein [Arthrobacter sp. A2-55]